VKRAKKAVNLVMMKTNLY